MSSVHNIGKIITGHSEARPSLCLFTDSFEPSGMGEHMLTLAAALKDDYRITFVCPPTAACQDFLVRARRLGLETLALAVPFDDKAAINVLCRWLKARHFDIFHDHAGIGWEGFGGIEAAREAGVPIVIRTEHLPYLLTHPTQQQDHRRIMSHVDRLICVSYASRTSYIEAGYAPRLVSVVHNGITIRPSRLSRNKARSQLGQPANAQIVLTVGRLSEQKGYHVLLQAIPAVLRRKPATQFLWVGDGPLKDELSAEIGRLGLANHVHLLGRRSDVSDLLAAADLFVLPSLFEGFPLSLLEAMSAGLPIVGTRVCGTSEAVIEGETGRLVPERHPQALAEAVLEVLEHPDRAAQWGRTAYELVRNKYSAAHMARATSAIYNELLAAYRLPDAGYNRAGTEYQVVSTE